MASGGRFLWWFCGGFCGIFGGFCDSFSGVLRFLVVLCGFVGSFLVVLRCFFVRFVFFVRFRLFQGFFRFLWAFWGFFEVGWGALVFSKIGWFLGFFGGFWSWLWM